LAKYSTFLLLCVTGEVSVEARVHLDAVFSRGKRSSGLVIEGTVFYHSIIHLAPLSEVRRASPADAEGGRIQSEAGRVRAEVVRGEADALFGSETVLCPIARG
jgi:hypothetical protein